MKNNGFILVAKVMVAGLALMSFMYGCASSASNASSQKLFTPIKGTIEGGKVEYQAMDIGHRYSMIKLPKDGKYFVSLIEQGQHTSVGLKTARKTPFQSDFYFVSSGPYIFDIDSTQYTLEDVFFTRDRVNTKVIIRKSGILTQDILRAIFDCSVLKIVTHSNPIEISGDDLAAIKTFIEDAIVITPEEMEAVLQGLKNAYGIGD